LKLVRNHRDSNGLYRVKVSDGTLSAPMRIMDTKRTLHHWAYGEVRKHFHAVEAERKRLRGKRGGKANRNRASRGSLARSIAGPVRTLAVI